ncbi:ferrous iron transport protein B [Clostridia bacterium]|nr:ferrous iron transport protein B [Clostridia bacterium]
MLEISKIKIALAGNPNCGKTTLFNALTGSNQFVGNWPGVTVEKKEGKLKWEKIRDNLQTSENTDDTGTLKTQTNNRKTNESITITDLPGIYSLSPYTLEEVVARNYLVDERPDVILNIIDGTSLERSLFLTTQLTEIGIPVVIAVNMLDILKKTGDVVNLVALSEKMGCKTCSISALKEDGIFEAVRLAIDVANNAKSKTKHIFSGSIEHTLAHIEEFCLHSLPDEQQRYFAIKLFERDTKIIEKLKLTDEQIQHIDQDIKKREQELDDDSESIIIVERYNFIDSIIKDCVKLKHKTKLSTSDKIDKIVTNRILALPIFVAIMFVVYYVSVTSVGSFVTDWMNETLFGNIISPAIKSFLVTINCDKWLQGLILDGMVAGVGAVLGFVPQMFVLFAFLAFLESCGYMARIAFIMDRIFRRFGLSGKSFIPILIGTGCGVPGIMSSRTIENDRDRKITIITTTFIPCSAKLPIIALISGAIFDNAGWVATSAYFVGILAIICSGVILKKTRLFTGEISPFIMELPLYHMPTIISILRSMWERGWSFIKKAGTIILVATVLVWFLSGYGFENGKFTAVAMDSSLMASIGHGISWLFKPLGWDTWKAAVATITGLIAKENVVSTFGILYNNPEVSENGSEIWASLRLAMTPLIAYSFLIFNLLCAPCFAAIGAIRREMNNVKWFWFAIGYQCTFAYCVALCVYQYGLLLSGHSFTLGSFAAIIISLLYLYMLFRSGKKHIIGKLAFNRK